MFFLDEDEDLESLNDPEFLHLVTRELYDIGASLEANPYVDRIPTHTEDGIPIRKLYVSNLPPKTSRTELFGIFAQYGFIRSCWLRMGERGPTKSPTPAYAFVTFSDPADAHRALEAPTHEKCLRGRNLRISPADSWHQPVQDPDGQVRWKVRTFNNPQPTTADEEGANANLNYTENTEQAETSTTESEAVHDQEDTPLGEETYDILDILNRDCLDHVLSYIPLVDIIRSERVSKRWQNMVQQHLESFRTFKTTWWALSRPSLTTAVLRRVLQRLGGSLTRLHIDHHWSALNDRTAHIVGKFCPNLEEFKVVGMHTKNWNPLIYGCKSLRSLKFVSCNKLTDSSVYQLVKSDTSVESISVTNNTHITGSFLTFSNSSKLSSLSLNNCYSLQGAVISAGIDSLPNLTTLRIDVCPVSLWRVIPQILVKVPKLEHLSLSHYSSDYQSDISFKSDFSNAFASLTELKILNLSRNVYVSNAVLKQIGQSCFKLVELNISSCNPKKNYQGVTDEGLTHISNCKQLSRLDVSYLSGVTDTGLMHVARLPQLTELTARGIAALTARPFVACLANCPFLQVIDACGCDSVSEEVAYAAVTALTTARSRTITLYLAATQASVNAEDNIPTHRLLTVNTSDDRCDHHLRPDFVDQIFDGSSDESFDDMYENDPFDEFFMADEDLFLDDEDDYEEYEGLPYGFNGPNIILL